MRRIDRFISFCMWVAIAISVLVILGVAARKNVYGSDWPFTLALCLLWVPPALSLAWEDVTGPQSPWFYRFAILTLLSYAAVGVYGFFLFEPNQ